jgi:CheY-like chemotaxis protein
MSSSQRKFNFTVLYVEDEENDVLLLEYAWREALVEERLEVAKNGKEALNYFQRQGDGGQCHEFPRCLLVLLDLNLPQVTGFELLSWVRKHDHFKRLPVIILTSSKQNHDIQLAYELGANAFLVKPANLDALVKLVRSIKDFWLEQNTFPDCPA